MTCSELGGKMAVVDLSAPYPELGRPWELSTAMLLSPMTRHDFEAWLDHHLDQTVLVEWRAAWLPTRSR